MVGMGMSMPSCPGQQAMQQQIDTLQTAQTDLQKKLQAMDAQLKAQSATNDQVKTLLEQMTGAIQAQRGALEQLNTDVKDLKARPVPAPAPVKTVGKARPAKKKGH